MKNDCAPAVFVVRPQQYGLTSRSSKLASRVLDEEGSFFVRNWTALTPRTFEEFDLSFNYQYWTPEINTSRRGDHATRFKTT